MSMTKFDAKELWKKVKENVARIQSCPCHRFDTASLYKSWEIGGRHAFNQKVFCENCRGEMDVFEARTYVSGFIAAGGDPNLVWPGWFDHHQPQQTEQKEQKEEVDHDTNQS